MTNGTKNTFVFTVDAVRRAVDNLTADHIHEHFPGYLAVLRAMRADDGRTAKMSDIHDFHTRYLYAASAPERRPYIRPFKSRGTGPDLANANVSGSYSPSSIRAKGKLVNVLSVTGTGQDAEYSLKPDHAAAAFESLLFRNKVPVTSLAAFLYRDYGFILDAPEIWRVVYVFRDEFGLRSDVPSEDNLFRTLFADDSGAFDGSDLVPVTGDNG